jgi:hypothetical protein
MSLWKPIMSPPWWTPGMPYFVFTSRPMPYVSSLPIGTCGTRRSKIASLVT